MPTTDAATTTTVSDSVGWSCRPYQRLARLGLVSVVVLALGAGCGGDDGDEGDASEGSTVAVTLSEWNLDASPASVTAGEVTFEAENAGTVEHEMVIVRSDVAPGDLPVVDDAVPEDEVDAVDEIGEFEAGTTETGTFELTPGTYILMCNIPTHYSQGMYAGLTVTG